MPEGRAATARTDLHPHPAPSAHLRARGLQARGQAAQALHHQARLLAVAVADTVAGRGAHKQAGHPAVDHALLQWGQPRAAAAAAAATAKEHGAAAAATQGRHHHQLADAAAVLQQRIQHGIVDTQVGAAAASLRQSSDAADGAGWSGCRRAWAALASS